MTAVPGLRDWTARAVPAGDVLWVAAPDDALRECGSLVLDRVLHRVPRPDALLAACREVLRPAGTLVVVVPAPGRSWAELRRGAHRADLRAGWACAAAVAHPGWLLAAADFALLGDTRAVFDGAGVDLVAEGAWPAPTVRVPRPGPTLPTGFRRLVARR